MAKSVMDEPSKDMRDPAYRKQLEREQALETSAPEFAFVGPAGKAQSSLKSAKDILTRIPDPKELAYRTINYGIGSGMGRITDEVAKKALQGMTSAGDPDYQEIRKQKFNKEYNPHMSNNNKKSYGVHTEPQEELS